MFLAEGAIMKRPESEEYRITCANRKCGRYFTISSGEAILNPKLRCPHCRQSYEYDLLQILHE
jgi:hypothetical protein